jgi:hypothetical protein
MCTETGESLPGTIDQGVSCEQGSKEREPTSNNNHINDIYDARVFESFEDFDFSKSSDRHPFLLVVHENPLKGNDLSRSFLNRLVYLTGQTVRAENAASKPEFLPKRPFPQLGCNVIVMNRATSWERATVS